MSVDAFAGARGKIEVVDNQPTFMPDDPPAEFTPDNTLLILLSKADRKVGELCGTAASLPNPQLVIKPLASKESLSSSRIEGTHATLPEVFAAEVAKEKPSTNTREVLNAAKTLSYGAENCKTDFISLIKEMHKLLFEEIPYGYGIPGEFRARQNFLSATNRIEDAWYVPPAPQRVPELMANLAAYIDAQHYLPPLVKAAFIHYQFETVHPFIDGNGRIGRAIIPICLLRQGYINLPIVFLSEYFEKYRPEYQDRLLEANKTGNFQKWLEFFLIAVINQAELTIQRANQLTELRKKYREQLKAAKTTKITGAVLDELFVLPYTTAPYVSEKTGTVFPTAQRAIGNLVSQNILKEITGQKRYRIFVAPEIMAIVDPGNPIINADERR